MTKRIGADKAQKQAAKAARRKATVAEKRKADLVSQSLAGRIAAAARGPLETCLRSAGLFEVGIGQVVIVRRLPSGLFGCIFFLVDVWCLGAKEITYKDLSPSDLEEALSAIRKGGSLVETELACARKLVTEAVRFAAASRFEPAKSYRVALGIFGDAAPDDCHEAFAFGKDGIPTYVDNTGDPPSRVRQIMATLEKVHGPDGWDVMMDQSITSPFGQMKALINSLRDEPGMIALRREIEAHGAAPGATIDHEPSVAPNPD